jgi:hypothetical protein
MRTHLLRLIANTLALLLALNTHQAIAQGAVSETRTTQRGLGLQLQNVNGKIVVRSVLPGSIAANSNAIEPGSQIIAITIGGTKTSLDGMELQDVGRLIRNASFDEPLISLTLISPEEETETVVSLRRSSADIESDSTLYYVQIDERKSLEQAVREFNYKAKHHSVGKTQTPLTADEVVSAIRSKNAKGNARLEEIAETRLLIPGEELSFISGWITEGNYVTVWWIDLRVKGHGLRIRDQTLSSRKLTSEELAAQEQFHERFNEQIQKLRKGESNPTTDPTPIPK